MNKTLLLNYLGHIYFSNNDHLLAQANLYGDWFKGSFIKELDPLIQYGIYLHREIDQFIDSHEIIKNNLLPVLRLKLPKVSNIAIDLYFDHLLSIHWDHFHPISIEFFLNEFYSHIGELDALLPSKFADYLKLLRAKKWINQYNTEEGLRRLCHGVSSRLSFETSLVNAPLVFKEEEVLITDCFFRFMQSARAHFEEWHLNNGFQKNML
jgi:acyl carrier protein phosphodiesterase